MRTPTIMGSALLSLLAGVAFAADDAAKVFDDIYGPRVKAAVATLDKADDHTLVAELTKLGAEATTDEALAIVLFTQAYDLAMRDPSGAMLASDAMAALAARVESQRRFATEKRIDALNLALLRGKAEQREAVGEEMVDLLIELGDDQAEAGEFDAAAATYRRAATAAARIKTRSPDDVKTRLETVMQQARTARLVEQHRAKLLTDRNDTATGEALVKLYLTELDDPAGAKMYLDIVKDESLKTAATLAGKQANELTEAEAMTLAEWYFAQSRGAKGLAEGVTLARAKQTLERYLALHTATDLARSKALAMQEEVNRLKVTLPVKPTIDSSTSKQPPKMPQGALLIYSFEKATIAVNRDGSIIRDQSRHACDGIMDGPVAAQGIAGDGLQFDGKDDFVKLTKVDKLITDKLGELSIVTWVKTDPKKANNIPFDIGFYGDKSITLRVGDRLYFSLFGRSLPSSTALDSRWHHVACTWDGRERRVYIDGALSSKEETARLTLTSETVLLTGGNGGPPRLGSQAKPHLREGRFYIGLLDEFALFAKALSEQEVKQIYEAGKAGIHFGQYK